MSATKATPMPRNGVDVPKLFATLDAIKANNEIAKFQFRVTNKWLKGTHSVSTINGYYGAMQEFKRPTEFMFGGDQPPDLVGADNPPTPVEYLLHALAACLTAGIGNIASARGINLEMVESTVEGNIDLLGLLGLDEKVRNGYQGVRISFRIKGDACDERLGREPRHDQLRAHRRGTHHARCDAAHPGIYAQRARGAGLSPERLECLRLKIPWGLAP